jgi:hypothetical protein
MDAYAAFWLIVVVQGVAAKGVARVSLPALLFTRVQLSCIVASAAPDVDRWCVLTAACTGACS